MTTDEDANAMNASSQVSGCSDNYFADESENDGVLEVAKPRVRIKRPYGKWARQAEKAKEQAAKTEELCAKLLGQDTDVKDAEATDDEDDDAFEEPPNQEVEAMKALSGPDRQMFLIDQGYSSKDVGRELELFGWTHHENSTLYLYRRVGVIQVFDDHFMLAIVAKRSYHEWRYKLQGHGRLFGQLPEGHTAPPAPSRRQGCQGRGTTR